MRRYVFNRLTGLTFAILTAAFPAMATPRIFPTSVTLYDPAGAYNSFISFSALDGATHLIDMSGNEVHRWPHPGAPGAVIDPALVGGAKGHVLLQTENIADPRGGIFTNKSVAELDWYGTTIWQWGADAPGSAARQNHDWARLPNGNTLLLVTRPRVLKALGPKEVGDQGIYEVGSDGMIVWSWFCGDHLGEFGFSPASLAYLRSRIAHNPEEPWGYLEINDLQRVGPNRWFDGGDKRFDPENIVIDSRQASFIAIIEKKTGKIVWRRGPDHATDRTTVLRPTFSNVLPRDFDQTSGQHDAHIIPKGLPGAGNLLVFDNESASGFPPTRLGMFWGSRILEIDPITRKIVWQYSGLDSGAPLWSFGSAFISSARRLPNGNTLIDEGMNGRIIQVTPGGEIVWEYVNPYFAREPLAEGRPVRTNWVFRAQPVPYDWVPENTPHGETALPVVDVSNFHVPGSR